MPHNVTHLFNSSMSPDTAALKYRLSVTIFISSISIIQDPYPSSEVFFSHFHNFRDHTMTIPSVWLRTMKKIHLIFHINFPIASKSIFCMHQVSKAQLILEC